MAAMSLQFPLFSPRSEQPVSRSAPTIALVFDVLGVNWQLRMFSKQLHAASLGVGGSVLDASHVEFCGGHDG